MRKKPITQPEVPAALIDALEAVLARLWEAERCDFHDAGGSTGPEEGNHFFLELEVIRRWLDYVEEDFNGG